jgi:uncharacterized protein (DUF433 family)
MSDPILAFNTHEARALTGVSLRRLQYWDETDFIRPSVAARRGRGSPRLYGFRDLIALRVAARLRDQLSLQALRKLKEALDVDAPFASVRFALLPGGDVVYLGPTGHLEAARRPGQITMSFDIPLEEIRADLRAGVDALRERSGVGGIERRRGVLAGQPAVAGTRITPAAIRRMVEDGWSVDRILEEFPDLRPEDVAVALARAG